MTNITALNNGSGQECGTKKIWATPPWPRLVSDFGSGSEKHAYTQGRRHIFFFGGGVGFIGTQTHLPQKISFSSDLGHFILKTLENAKLLYVSRKKTKISKLLEGGGRASPWFPKMRPEPGDPPLETPLHRYTGPLSYDFVSNSLHVPRSPNNLPFYTLHSPFGIGDALFLTVPTPTSAPLADPGGGGQPGHGPLKLRKVSHHVFWPQNLPKTFFRKWIWVQPKNSGLNPRSF